MTRIKKFFLRDIRCFGGGHEFDIRPLTFFIGENSTGKSTVMGCLQAVGNLSGSRFEPHLDFNSEPYQMGAFTDIVRRSNPRNKHFELGLEFEIEGKELRYFLNLTERDRGSEPIISNTRLVFDDEGEIVFFNHEGDPKKGIEVTAGKNQDEFHVYGMSHRFDAPSGYLAYLWYLLHDSLEDLDDVSAKLLQYLDRHFPPRHKKDSHADRFHHMRRLSFDFSGIHSIAPIRSKPKRTYDPLKETETSDGSEIPMTLMNLSTSSAREWETLRKQLLSFGRASGLFSDISLRRLGRSKSDPFQLRIKVRGPATNLMDVGYGISQVLPILVRIFTRKRAKFLLQQPEVHLHPKGQAELASLLVDINRTRKNSFVIETHSDYMIDRVRIEILNGRIKPDDVSLIYLEPFGNQVKTHNIGFDTQANMINVPVGYRDFFFDESEKLLGFKD